MKSTVISYSGDVKCSTVAISGRAGIRSAFVGQVRRDREIYLAGKKRDLASSST
jgi:hypothetical protein